MAKFSEISTRARRIMSVTTWIAVPNFAAFWFAAVYLGGDALNGYVQNGHYYLCAHGSCREVAKSVWDYSYWHAISAIVGIVLVFVEAAIFVTTKDIVLDFDKGA